MRVLDRILPLLMAPGLLASTAAPSRAEGVERVAAARANVLAELGACFGVPVFIRIIKESRLLELWVQQGGFWQVLKTYPIAGMSGTLGPKQKEGDKQAPEGFYDVVPERMNPRSRYHLAMNIGYPNDADRAEGRTGSLIMIHGSDASVGCFAMTDPGIEEIYTMVNEAFACGQQRVQVHIYPFEMTEERLEQERDNPHFAFWRTLQPHWQHTHDNHCP